jgi:hypothetical protein
VKAGNRGGGRHKRGRGDGFGGVRLLGLRAPFDAGAQTTIGLKNHFALKALRDGRGNDDAMARLGHALNVGLVLCELDVGAEYLPLMHSAQNALVVCATRSNAAGRWQVRDTEFKAICLGLEVHDAQLERASLEEVAAAEREISRRVACGDVIQVNADLEC